jgi:hypothetical protein
MSIVSDYTFFNISRIGNDVTDHSQRSLQNVNYSNYMLSNYYSNNDAFIDFATETPTMNAAQNGGSSVGAAKIDADSQLHIKNDQGRPGGKIQLSERMFLTIPYLGRGSCDPTLEAKLQQGDVVSGKKSVSTISENTYIDYYTYPMMDDLRNTVTNPNNLIEENAGWTRGGKSAR